MSRPTVALCMIAKNEAHNLGPLLQTIKGCFDEIHITDTGSTDGTLEFIEKVNGLIESKSPDWLGLPTIQVHHFAWIHDFAAARNYSFGFTNADYITWLDLDDRLSSASAFINWRDNVMHSAHYWLAKYNYAFDAKGNVECEFVRERVIKNNHGFKWEYFVHEGLIQKEEKQFWPQKVASWWVDHARTEDDRKADFMRNINLIEKHDVEAMPARMKFYYGKELVENGLHDKGAKPLLEALKDPALDIHDRILAFQYAAQAAFHSKAYSQAMDLLRNGSMLMLSRAEYWCLLGDVYQAQNSAGEAMQAYRIALTCKQNTLGGIVVTYANAYFEYPHMQIANLSLQIGDIATATASIEALKSVNSDSAAELEKRLIHVADLSTIRMNLPKTTDVIITCPPQGAVTDWDENSLKEKGHGGSETAAIEVAAWITKKTGRKVKIFQPRARREIMASGVEYCPSGELAGYLQNIEPAAHIAWRHAIKLTNAKSYIWCHDLQCAGADKGANYDKIVALSEFHRNYLQETNGVRADKIALGFNGINPNDFSSESFDKDPLKVVFSSSPDRGLVQSIDIVKKAREISGLDIKLHCFYGVANMRKMGLNDWADQIENKIKENDFVIYHGMVTKTVLMEHFQQASVWLYPADFIETYCITAIEALCAGVWPIVRDMGALKYTMKEAIAGGMCDVLSSDAKTEASVGLWANTLVKAIIDQKFRTVKVNPQDYSWEKVADFFIKEMGLSSLETSNTTDLRKLHSA